MKAGAGCSACGWGKLRKVLKGTRGTPTQEWRNIRYYLFLLRMFIALTLTECAEEREEGITGDQYLLNPDTWAWHSSFMYIFSFKSHNTPVKYSILFQIWQFSKFLIFLLCPTSLQGHKETAFWSGNAIPWTPSYSSGHCWHSHHE